MEPLSSFFLLEAAIVLYAIKILFNFLHRAVAEDKKKKKQQIVPCICVIIWDCDAALGTSSWMGFINTNNAWHWSYGNIYRFPWILCSSCIHLNTSRHKYILLNPSGWPLFNTSLAPLNANYRMCVLFDTVILLLLYSSHGIWVMKCCITIFTVWCGQSNTFKSAVYWSYTWHLTVFVFFHQNKTITEWIVFIYHFSGLIDPPECSTVHSPINTLSYNAFSYITHHSHTTPSFSPKPQLPKDYSWTWDLAFIVLPVSQTSSLSPVPELVDVRCTGTVQASDPSPGLKLPMMGGRQGGSANSSLLKAW